MDILEELLVSEMGIAFFEMDKLPPLFEEEFSDSAYVDLYPPRMHSLISLSKT